MAKIFFVVTPATCCLVHLALLAQRRMAPSLLLQLSLVELSGDQATKRVSSLYEYSQDAGKFAPGEGTERTRVRRGDRRKKRLGNGAGRISLVLALLLGHGWEFGWLLSRGTCHTTHHYPGKREERIRGGSRQKGLSRTLMTGAFPMRGDPHP